jgi:hypothetical protein
VTELLNRLVGLPFTWGLALAVHVCETVQRLRMLRDGGPW